jgi:uncharacterized protein (DUF736 family)
MENNTEKKGDRPDFRICQAVQVLDEKGVSKNDFKSVGAAWKNKSKVGNTYYRVRIGTLELLMFPNDDKPKGTQSKF